jgi:hypothetical protein
VIIPDVFVLLFRREDFAWRAAAHKVRGSVNPLASILFYLSVSICLLRRLFGRSEDAKYLVLLAFSLQGMICESSREASHPDREGKRTPQCVHRSSLPPIVSCASPRKPFNSYDLQIQIGFVYGPSVALVLEQSIQPHPAEV